MKKLLVTAILSISAVAFVPSIEAKSTNTASNAVSEPQIRVQIGPNRRRNNVRRVVTQTRNVRVGRRLYRETYRVTYRPNGTTRTQLISRVLIRNY